MSVKHNLEQWIAQLDYDDTCDISDRQVSELIRNYAALKARCAALAAKINVIHELMEVAEQVNKLAQEETEKLAHERNMLATENAALKDINAWCKTDAFKNMHREFKTAEAIGCEDADCMHDAMLVAIMHAPETPATDAFLAEVRAQGVDMFGQYHNFSEKLFIQKEAKKFADQLRKGVQS